MLLSAIAFGVPVDMSKVHIEGITHLEAKDIKFAEELGYRIKLLGITKYTDYGIELRVHPALVPTRRLLANVEGAMNAVVVKATQPKVLFTTARAPAPSRPVLPWWPT